MRLLINVPGINCLHKVLDTMLPTALVDTPIDIDPAPIREGLCKAINEMSEDDLASLVQFILDFGGRHDQR